MSVAFELPAELRAFFDAPDPAALVSHVSLDEPLDPRELLDARPPGLPIDFVPLVSDGTGSFLCARVEPPTGGVAELVFWAHDDWSNGLPYGRSITEALLIDAARAEAANREAIAFALEHGALSPQLRAGLARVSDGETSLASLLLAHGVGVESLGMPWDEARGSRVEIADPHFVKYYGVAGELAGRSFWYSLDGLPPKTRAALERDYHGLREPEWDVMELAGRRVIALRDDIGWAWVLLADVAGFRRDSAAAQRAVAMASRSLMRTFSIHGRDLLRGVESEADRSDPLVRAFLDEDADAIAAHWEREAHDAERAGDFARALNAWYRHVYHAPRAGVTDAMFVETYARLARAAGFTGFERIVAAKS